MKLNKKVMLGIKAVNTLKNRENPTGVADIASEVGTTVNFLQQIMRLLRVKGLVLVKRGPGGGYFIPKDTSVNALQIAQALGRDFESSYVDETPTSRLNKAIIEAFQNTTI